MKGVDQLKVGSFVLAGILLFVASVWIMGTEREIFASQEEFKTTFKDVKGLRSGAPVRLGGITVGRVGDISFGSDPQETIVHVTFLVNERYLDRLREDTRTTLETQGLLGDRFLGLSVGTSETRIAPGGLIPGSESSEVTEVLGKASKVVDNTVEISENLKAVSDTLKGEPLKNFSEGMTHLSEVSKSINEITREIRSGKGLVHSLIYDDRGGDALTSFTEAAAALSETAQEISTFVKASSPTETSAGLGDVMRKLNETAENLKKASDALKDGSGTLGALLVDSKLYDNLVEVTDGAKRSIILREAVRSSLNN